MSQQSQLPKGWRWLKLKDVIREFVNGGTPNTNIPQFWNGGIPWITSADIKNLYVSKGRKYISQEGLYNSSTHLVKKDTVLIATRTGVGKVAIAENDLCFSQDITGVVCTDEIFPEFLARYLLSQGDNLIRIQRGATIKGLTREDIESLFIPLPAFAEQRRIAAKIQELMQDVDRARAACKKQLEAAKVLPTAYLREVFESKEAKNWEKKKLGEVCIINPSRPKNFTRAPNELTTFIPMAAVDGRTGTVAKSEVVPYLKVSKGYTYFEENDVLFAKITPCMQNGKHVIVRNLIDGIGFGTTEFHVLRPGKEILPGWIWYFVRRACFLHEATTYFSGAVGQQRVPKDFLANYSIPCPPLSVQKYLVAGLNEKTAGLEKIYMAAKKQLDIINVFPQKILNRAFKGEL